MGVIRRYYGVEDSHVNNITASDIHIANIWTRDQPKLDYDISHLIETPYAGGFR